MCPNAAERRLAAILCADVVGYSRLMAEDEAGTVRTLTDYREEIAVLVRQHRGRVVDTAGDNLLAEGDRIYGDGGNIAARLEALAGPGGACISEGPCRCRS